MRSIDIAASALCGVLYGVLGYVVYLFTPITTPGIGIVRFWPIVVIPAVFAVLFGPIVGGLGAAIGIFISDLLIHGDPLLSLLAGVTANFIGFYLLGYFSRRKINWDKTLAIISIVLMIVFAITEYVPLTYFSLEATILFLGISIASYTIMVIIGHFYPQWRSYSVASIVGLLVGSTIMGFVVWAYSQIFLPSSGCWRGLPITALRSHNLASMGIRNGDTIPHNPWAPNTEDLFPSFPTHKPI
ncbi:MAG: hypothetical protein QXT26_03255 [Thermoproteota archaeon]